MPREDDGDYEPDQLNNPDTPQPFPCLDEPKMCFLTAMQLHQMMEDGQINLIPDYQREEVWNTKAQSGVIVSYLQRYHVPPIVLRENEDMYECIDGKQRLTSLRRFFCGEFPIRSPGAKEKFWYVRKEPNKNKGGKLLPTALRQRIEEMKIYVTKYVGLTDDETREMFKRVQTGKALNNAEKIHAVNSTWANYIKELDNGIPQKFWETISFREHRMAAFLSLVRVVWYLTRLGYTSSNSKLVNLPSHPSPEALRDWASYEPKSGNEVPRNTRTDAQEITTPTKEFKNLVTTTLRKFQFIANNTECFMVAFCPVDQLPIGQNKAWYEQHYPGGMKTMTMSPVEVVCCCIYISRNIDLHPATLARGIHSIRNMLHERFPKERKLNNLTMAHFWAWLKKQHDGNGGAAEDCRVPASDTDYAAEDIRSPQKKRKRESAAEAGGSSGTPKRIKIKKGTQTAAAPPSNAGAHSSAGPGVVNQLL